MSRPVIGYCTNIHPGESWADTFANLQTHVLAVRDGAREDKTTAAAFPDPYPIGLRLSAEACATLRGDTSALAEFRAWCEREKTLIYTVNGFPYGQFHGKRVKEQVYAPDWAKTERLDYTLDLFRLLAALTPEDKHLLTVSTVPGSFKAFIHEDGDPTARLEAIRTNLRKAAEQMETLAETTERDLSLGLEPEPLGLIENTTESLEFFDFLTHGLSSEERDRFLRRIGITFDTCHAAVEFENAYEALERYLASGVHISKIHLSNALSLDPRDPEAIKQSHRFIEPTYLHQVIAKRADGSLHRFLDLPDALRHHDAFGTDAEEWRIHYHIPLYSAPEAPLGNTAETLAETAIWLRDYPGVVSHFEMETYTFDVMPEGLRPSSAVEMLVNEHHWCAKGFLPQLAPAGN